MSQSLNEDFLRMRLSDQDSPEVQKFRKLSQRTQRKLLQDYPAILAATALSYGRGDDCETIVKRQLESAPEFLRSTDKEKNNVLGRSLLTGNAHRAKFLINLAASRNTAALHQRNVYAESLEMLCVALGNNAPELMNTLLRSDISQVHRLYDINGQNLLHHCVANDSIEPLRAALSVVGQQPQLQENCQLAEQMRAAFEMNDDNGDTPLHIAAARNRSDMLRLINEFCITHRVNIDFDVRQLGGNRRTPLMEAAAREASDVCEYLVRNDLVDIDLVDRSDLRAADLTQKDELKAILSEAQHDFEDQQQGQASEIGLQRQQESQHTPALTSLDNETVDSGCHTGAFSSDVKQFVKNDLINALTEDKISRICDRLKSTGKSQMFIDKLSEKYRTELLSLKDLIDISEEPAQILLGQIHNSPNVWDEVCTVLVELGESQLAHEED